MVEDAALPIPEDMGEGKEPWLPGRQQLFAGEFRRRMQVKVLPGTVETDEICRKTSDMRLIARGDLQGGRIDLDEVGSREPAPHGRHDARPGEQHRAAILMDRAGPPAGSFRLRGCCHSLRALPYAGTNREISIPRAISRRLLNRP